MFALSRVFLLATLGLVALLATGGAGQYENTAPAFTCVADGKYPLVQNGMCCGTLSPAGKASASGQVFKHKGACFRCNVVFIGDRGYWDNVACPSTGYVEARQRPFGRPSGSGGFFAVAPSLGGRRPTWA